MKEAYWETGEPKICAPMDRGCIEVEYGCSQAVNWIKPEDVTMVNCAGEEVPYPICEKCGTGKVHISGKEAFAWICMTCAFPEEK